ncbi:hypothetical protein ACQEU5_25145 [Marinactinospora thermotolerans]|uniref:hypothetical protein n=1 Tax=Marinactinospora thermotolerans TaxID=531310 RepID=UPI003D8FECAC
MRTEERGQRVRILLSEIRGGSTIAKAATTSGIPLPTLKRWRRTDRVLDAAILEAAAQSGRRIGYGRATPRPVSPLTCPGPRCGTSTGYDYGCRKVACITAATDRIASWRRSRAQ